MAKSNIKLLTKDERQFFKDTYSFELKDDMILVKFNGYNRIVAHPTDRQFSISSKVRKITITVPAIKLWSEKFKDSKYSVVDIQNAMNALIIGYQATDYDDVKTQLDVIEKKDNAFIGG